MTNFRIPRYVYVIIFVLGIITFEATSFFSGLHYVLSKYRWQDTFTRFNSSYYKTSVEYGSLTPDLSRRDVLRTLIWNLKVRQLCENSVMEGCWPEKSFYADGSIAYSHNNYSGFILDNGILVSGINKSTQNCDSHSLCNIISIDINGKFGPNTYGKDQFRFYYYKDKVVPYYQGDDKLTGTTVKRFLNLK